MKDREVWIDMLKGYGILVVTLGHSGVNFMLEKHIYSYHMFLFFFISGFLFNDTRNLNETIRRKVQTLLIPFIAWDIVSSIIGIWINHLSFKGFISTLLILKGNLCFNAPIWFVLILFFTETLYPCLRKHISDVYVLAFSITLFVVVGALKLPLKINLIPLAMFAYVLGSLYKKYKNIAGGGLRFCLLLIINVVLSVIFGMILNDRISYTAGIFGNYSYCLIAAISGMLFFMLLFEKCFGDIKKDNILSYLGQNSFAIMAMQYYFFTAYNFIARRVIQVDDIWHWENSIKAVIMSAITVVGIMLIVEIYRYLSKRNRTIRKIGNVFGLGGR